MKSKFFGVKTARSVDETKTAEFKTFDPTEKTDKRRGGNKNPTDKNATDAETNGAETGGAESVDETKPAEERASVLAVKGLNKRYGKGKALAIEEIGFEVRAGEIVGIVGTNGAGKSTTIKCVTGFLPFDEGTIEIAGFDIEKDPVRAKRNFGYVPDDRAVFEKMTGMEYLNFVADIREVPAAARAERISEFQKKLKLGDKILNLISSYSHGMRQKICLMASLIHQPKLWILDEPMTGLDPQTTKSLKDMMVEYRDRGNGVLFSSHNLDVVEQISDRVVMIKKGRTIADGKLSELIAANEGKSFETIFLERYGDEE